MTLKELQENIAGITDWYKESDLEVYYEVGEDLLKKGIPGDEIVEMLGDLYHAAANEFGG